MTELKCPVCLGYRLKREVLAVTIHGKNIVDVSSTSIEDSVNWINEISKNESKKNKSKENNKDNENSTFEELFGIKSPTVDEDTLSKQELEIGDQIFKEIAMRLNFLSSVGLDYLTLNRTARTLSGGESQRIRLASQIGTGLTGVLYVLDEPSIGLHQRDNERLIKTLENLRDIGNTVIVVEHDEDTIRKADFVLDIGPKAGIHGGEVVAQGTAEEVEDTKESITGQYLSGKKKVDKDEIYKEIESFDPVKRAKIVKPKKNKQIRITNVRHNNLKGFDVDIPLGQFVCVTGVSGSGKSSLVNEVLYKAIARHLYKSKAIPGQYSEIIGLEHIDKVIDIDQSPIGRTPRSNPSTYTGVFTDIRDIFASTKEAKSRGYKSGRFSFNVKGGRCEKCQGAGVIQISMQFLPDVYVTCEECDGQRYNRETLQIDYKGKSIAGVLEMTIDESTDFFKNIPKIYTKLVTLQDVGLGYIKLGQAATTLSGGESQRVKLSSELAKRSTGKTFYILDEPTTGLHFEDVRKLLVVLHSLVAKGNTVLVIEHNLDVIKTADHIIDLGPEGGDGGGTIVALGTPKDIAETKESYTGKWLKELL
ncbi:MAG: excinuclease ABC subunit UvrA [Candidatus Dojkabacteria bacterium]|nr:excinuclease ABC subunit UvrA [Candidatus Dojkabacteria bacterium]